MDQKKMKQKGILKALFGPSVIVGSVVLLFVISRLFPFRIDLTEEKRYSLHPATKAVLQSLEEPLEVEILLTGKLPGGMRRLQRSIEETLRTFNAYSSENIFFYYEDPLRLPVDAREDYVVSLTEYGINPTNLFVTEDGGQKSRLIFPGVMIRSEEFETGALLLRGEKGMSPDQILNQSIENLEFELINAIRKLITKKKISIGMILGHGELGEEDGFGIVEALVDDYEVFKIPMEQAKKVEDLDPFAVLIVAGPRDTYSEREIYLLDQYLMNGGNLLFLLDAVAFNLDEAGGEGTIAFPFETGLDQLLFKYGIRINKDLIQDLNFGFHPVMAGDFGDQAQMIPLPWPFYLAAGRMASHPITKGLDQVIFRFASSLDTVKADGVKKTPLIFGSDFNRKLSVPVRVAFSDMSEAPDMEQYGLKNLPLLYLLEGEFTSFFNNRFLPNEIDPSKFQSTGNEGRVVVAGTGNLFKSLFDMQTGDPLPLGEDPYANLTYANRLLLQNMIKYLVEPEGIIASRTKQFEIRPLNKLKVREERLKWQFINLVFPVLFLGLLGIIWVLLRKRRFSARLR